MSLAGRLAEKHGPLNILDIGCGAGRNSIPLAQSGHRVTGVDRAPNMLVAARQGALRAGVADRCQFVAGDMDHLGVAAGEFDLVVAHGVWNLADGDEVFLRAVAEAARAARAGASLFVFTFARVPATPAAPPGSRFAVPLTDGTARCYVTEADLDAVLAERGFHRASGPLTLYNAVPRPGSPPPIFEGCWTRMA
jgi:ubiquinone/menaquinone biosynthesis C-methylase UbiE